MKKYLKSKIDYFRLKKGCIILIHIGKCGGRTVRDGIKNAVKNKITRTYHTIKPFYRKDLKYIIVARSPLARLNSAFNWRYKLVVTDGIHKNKYQGEYNTLIKYKNLNALAEVLYDEKLATNHLAHNEIQKIHHIKQDIAYYLSDLLSKCDPSQIIGVLMQENLDDDIYRIFGCRNEIYRHYNLKDKREKDFSEKGLKNIMRYLDKDYQALIQLHCWGKINQQTILKII